MPVFPQLERMLWLHDQIKSARFPNAARLSEHFEVSAKTAQRDIACLRDRFQAPMEYNPARKGYYYTDDLYELPCLPASQHEILCLLMARNLLVHTAGGYISRELDALGEKLFTVARRIGLTPDATERAFSATWSSYSPAQEETFRLTAWALLNNRLLDFAYRSPQSDQTTHRIVEPHHLQHYMASWVLTAWCRNRGAWRKFYLARMSRLNTLDQNFTPRPQSQWQPFLDSAFGLFQGRETTSITLRFTPFRARWIREQYWHAAQELTELPGGGLELTLPAADFREIKMKILQFGADVEVVAPEALRQEIIYEIKEMDRIYRQPSLKR